CRRGLEVTSPLGNTRTGNKTPPPLDEQPHSYNTPATPHPTLHPMSPQKRRRTGLLTVATHSHYREPSPLPHTPAANATSLAPCHLCHMPDDILAHIAEHLTLASLWRLSQVSRLLRSIAYLSIRRQYDLNLIPRCPQDTDEFVLRLRRSLLAFDKVNGPLVEKIVGSIWGGEEGLGSSSSNSNSNSNDNMMQLDVDSKPANKGDASSSSQSIPLGFDARLSTPPRALRHRIKTTVSTLVQFGTLPLHPVALSTSLPSSVFARNACLVLERIAARANGAKERKEAISNLPHVPTLLTRSLVDVLEELEGRIKRLQERETRQCYPIPYMRVAKVKLYRRLEQLFIMISIFHTTFEIPTTTDVQKYIHILCHRIFPAMTPTAAEPDKDALGYKLRILHRLHAIIIQSGRFATDTTPLAGLGGAGEAVAGAGVGAGGGTGSPIFALSHPPPTPTVRARDRLRHRQLVEMVTAEMTATMRIQTAQVTRYVMRHGELMRQMIYHYPSMRKGAEKIIAALEAKIGELRKQQGDRPDALPMEHFRDFWTAILRDTAGYSIAPVSPPGEEASGSGAGSSLEQEYRTPLVAWTKEQVDSEGDRFMAYLEGCVSCIHPIVIYHDMEIK
ncbi:hypothetical protein BC936DRAFT_141762, partial [Jimgerdemannia flammicorona]